MKNVKLFLFISILYLCFLNVYGLIDPDEPRYAATAKNMVLSGNYIVPEFNGHLRINKPPLTYWLISLSYKLFGINEFSARLPHAFLGLLLIFAVFIICRELISEKIALLASLILSSNPFFIFLSRCCNTDMILNFFFSMSLLFFYKFYISKKRKFLILSLICYLFANLAKGPVAYLIPFIITIFLVFERDFSLFKNFFLILTVLISSLSPLMWLVFVGFKTGNINSMNALIFNETIGRMFKGYAHKEPFYFYFLYFPLVFFPWSLLFFTKIFKITSILKEKFIKFSLMWFLTVFIFFTLSKSKLLTYILPLSVPFSIICANLIENLKFNLNIKKLYFGIIGVLILLTGYLIYIQEFSLNFSIAFFVFLGTLLFFYLKNLEKLYASSMIFLFFINGILVLSGKYITDLKSEKFLQEINFPKEFKIIVFRKKLTGCAFYKGNYVKVDSIEKLKLKKEGNVFILTSKGMYQKYLRNINDFKIIYTTTGRVLLQ